MVCLNPGKVERGGSFTCRGTNKLVMTKFVFVSKRNNHPSDDPKQLRSWSCLQLSKKGANTGSLSAFEEEEEDRYSLPFFGKSANISGFFKKEEDMYAFAIERQEEETACALRTSTYDILFRTLSKRSNSMLHQSGEANNLLLSEIDIVSKLRNKNSNSFITYGFCCLVCVHVYVCACVYI